jgi:DNA repair protein RecO (recombination protein O)
MPTGDALLSGYYLNELLMRLLARDDPHPALFDAYAVTVELLASQNIDTLAVALRAFELRLLRDIGLLPTLDAQTATLLPLEPETAYVLVPEAGLREAHDDDRASLSGAQWLGLQQALADGATFSDTVQACMSSISELKPQLRALLHYHCGVKVLKTRQLMIDLQAL